MRALSVVLLFLLLVGLGGAALVYSGWYDVSATEPHTSITHEFLDTVKRRSVETRAQNAAVPDLSSEKMIREGAQHYAENCAVCHGAPGRKKNELAEGLMPPPPDLVKTVKDWRPAELHWIVKNGLRMTGMPAWGVSHDEDELWSIVAFLQRLPDMSATEFSSLSADSHNSHADHRH